MVSQRFAGTGETRAVHGEFDLVKLRGSLEWLRGKAHHAGGGTQAVNTRVRIAHAVAARFTKKKTAAVQHPQVPLWHGGGDATLLHCGSQPIYVNSGVMFSCRFESAPAYLRGHCALNN